MKIAISSSGKDLDSPMDPRFGRCAYFLIAETGDMSFEVLNNDERREEMAERNYQLGNKYFSYEVLERHLLHLVNVLEIQCKE